MSACGRGAVRSILLSGEGLRDRARMGRRGLPALRGGCVRLMGDAEGVARPRHADGITAGRGARAGDGAGAAANETRARGGGAKSDKGRSGRARVASRAFASAAAWTCSKPRTAGQPPALRFGSAAVRAGGGVGGVGDAAVAENQDVLAMFASVQAVSFGGLKS